MAAARFIALWCTFLLQAHYSFFFLPISIRFCFLAVYFCAHFLNWTVGIVDILPKLPQEQKNIQFRLQTKTIAFWFLSLFYWSILSTNLFCNTKNVKVVCFFPSCTQFWTKRGESENVWADEEKLHENLLSIEESKPNETKTPNSYQRNKFIFQICVSNSCIE